MHGIEIHGEFFGVAFVDLHAADHRMAALDLIKEGRSNQAAKADDSSDQDRGEDKDNE